MTTCLSPKKHHLVCELGALVSPAVQQEDGWIPSFDKETGLLLWSCDAVDGVKYHIGSVTAEAVYEEHVVSLAPYCHAVHQWIHCLRESDIRDLYKEHLEWTGNSELFLDCFDKARSSRPVESSLSILLSTAALERALGDVFLMKSKDPCPAMLKNLLATRELGNTLGENAIALLRILIGPPVSLNLRNILWHGFAAPEEIPQRYGTFFLVVVASLGAWLAQRGITACCIPHRVALRIPQTDTDVFKQTFPDISSDDVGHLWELYSTNEFFHKPMLPYCQAALDYFREEKYGMVCVLLLPQLENAIRHLFATANNCPERILTAESEYFTTFDEMLRPYLSDETAPNALIQTVGETYMKLLLDILVHPEGPRLRDHISHGELDLQTVTRATAAHVMSICAAFCLRQCPNRSLTQIPLLSRIAATAESYAPLFHPVSLLKAELLTFLESLSQWVAISMPEDLGYAGYQTWSNTESPSDQLVRDAGNRFLALCDGMLGVHEDLLQSAMMPFAELEPLVVLVSQSAVKTLFRPRRELEVASLLRRITAQCLASCRNVKDSAELRYQQYSAKELRSRQRANYARLLNWFCKNGSHLTMLGQRRFTETGLKLQWLSDLTRLKSLVPRLSGGLRLVSLILLGQLKNLHSLSCRTSKEVELLLKFLKAVLRYAENLSSLTSPEKNKWDECCGLTDSLLQQVKTHCDKITKSQLSA